MQKPLLFGSLLCVSLISSDLSMARDLLLRPGADEPMSASGNATAPATRSVTGSPTQGLSTEERIARLERILESQGLVDMLMRLESLQNEIQALRGEIELHTHQLEEIKQRQRDLYVDIDRRLLRLERNGPAVGGEVAVPAATPQNVKPAGDGATGNASVASAAPQDIEAEQKAYQQAFDLLRELRYEQAVTAFRDFLKKYPNGRYAHIAQYWIGEANYAQRKYKDAIGDYQALIDNHPNSPKLAEAMLKIGYSYYELGEMKKAEDVLTQLTKSYPGTTEAGQAQNLIQKIRLKR